MKRLLLMLLLAVPTAQAGAYLEASGNIQRSTGASDWVLSDPTGRVHRHVGQVMLVAGYEYRGLSIFGGVSHQSLPYYGHDRGLNGPVLGISYQWNF